MSIAHNDWNETVRNVERMTPLPGTVREAGAKFNHPFKVTTKRGADKDRRQWKIKIVPGTISDNLVLYPYLKTGDPRGWKLPAGYITPDLLKVYGPDYPWVDRSPFETTDPPYLLVKAPGPDPVADAGDFVLNRTRPTFFQQKQFDGCALYRASVTVSLTPFRASKDYTPWNAALVTKAPRFRYFAGRLPGPRDGVRAGSVVELARLYLVRKPNGSGPASDRLFVQQYRYWCLQALAVEPTLGLGDSIDLSYLGIGSMALGLGGAVVGMIGEGLLEALGNIVLSEVNNAFESAAMTEFWSC